MMVQVVVKFFRCLGACLDAGANTNRKLTLTQHKKLRFPLRISLVNVTKSAVSCESGHIY